MNMCFFRISETIIQVLGNKGSLSLKKKESLSLEIRNIVIEYLKRSNDWCGASPN